MKKDEIIGHIKVKTMSNELVGDHAFTHNLLSAIYDVIENQKNGKHLYDDDVLCFDIEIKNVRIRNRHEEEIKKNTWYNMEVDVTIEED